MSRPYRIEFPGAVYHVTSRGNNHQAIVVDDQDRRQFISLLGKTVERFQLQLFSFCLMNNHYHLFLRTPQPNLNLAMQWLGANYTRAFNHRNDRDGHLFKGRYHSVLVDNNSHWLHLSAYIHLNPVRAGLVSSPGEWPWSSARDYLGSFVRYPWLNPGPVIAAFGQDDTERRRRYRRHLSNLVGRPASHWDSIRQSVFLGSNERWEELKLAHPPSGQVDSVTVFTNRAAAMVDFELELEFLATALKTTVEKIKAGKTGARLIAYYYLTKLQGLSSSDVAQRFGVSKAAVSMGISRLWAAMAQDEQLRRTVSELTVHIGQKPTA